MFLKNKTNFFHFTYQSQFPLPAPHAPFTPKRGQGTLIWERSKNLPTISRLSKVSIQRD